MKRRAVLSVVLLLAFAAALPASADEGAARRLALREAQEPLRARHWADAVQTLRRFREIHRATPEAVEAWVLEARALYLAGRAREALDATSAFLAAHGEAAWAGRMKFTAADAYAKLGDAKQGAATLRKRVNAATSVEARAAIGALHLKLADQDFDGVETKDDLGRTVKKRNVARALASYRHALEVGLEPEQAVRARERIALCLEEQKNYAEAAPAWKGLLEDADSGKLGTGAGGEAVARWSVGLGRSLLRGGQLPQARKVLREVLAAKPGGGLRMEVELLLGEERLETARQKSDDVAFEEGVTWIRRAIVENPDDERVAKSWKGLALAYEAHGDVEKAAAEWGALIERFPKADFVPQARDHRAQDLVRAGRFDRAIAEWERFLAAHPNDPLWQSVRGKIVEAAFRKGAWFANAADDPGAIAAWRAFAEKYPTDGRAPQALLQAAALLRKDQDFEAALTLARQVSGRYAKTAQAAPALWLEATILEDDLARLDDAVEVYEKLIEEYGSSAPVPEAQARLARLKEKHLELRMPRVIGTKEKPVLQVTTRNVKKLDVRVYRLDMEEYFRRKGTVLGVENLQLEVVKPDETATWTLAEYHPFEQVQADRSVPVEGKGAYVVVAGDEDLTATVLFLVSDAEIVVKKARGRDLLVWAFEREDQKPLAGARVLVARGRKVREVGKTGEDGVWHGQRGGDAEHVLVLSDAGLAATGLETGPAVASGYQSKAYVTTDRPVYRPGQEVHWRAIYLQASGGNYRAPGKKRGRVSVRDARGQTLFEKDVTSSAFGTFDGAFELDGVAPLGTWTVQVSVPRSGSWTGNFDVQEFRKPEFTVALEPKQPAYLTGETVEATAHVRYAFGGPVADAPVAYEVYRNVRTFEPARAEDYAWYFKDDRRADERRRQAVRGTLVKRGTAKTDAKGDVRISFETAVGDEDAEYVVKVAVEDVTRRWIVDQGRIPVTRRGYMAVVKADRKVYRPKQEMQVEVRTVDALERPVARSGQVLLLELKRHEVAVEPPTRRRLIDGKRPVRVEDEEIQRAAYPLSTDATGSAYLRVKVPGPGRWRLRWKATDGRGGLVTAFTDVEAAGEALDLAKDARLVAARPVYTEGDAAEVLLQSPVTGVKALLTYEGEKILAYRFVDVARPSTLLALPVTGDHAPNVFFAVAIPGSGRLLQADTEVVVLRYLDVEVSLPKVAGPGKKIQVTVKTTDARGRPTPAEVGVALVDETLYAIAPDRAPAIRPFFYDRRRQNAVTTASSLGFQVTGTTRATNKDLLADEAARSGDMKKAMALSALRNAREAMARGDVRTAALLALKAAEIDPSSYEARAFVATLRESREARKVLERTDRVVLDELERSAPMEPSTARRPSATPSARLRSKDKKGEDAFFEDNEVAEEAKGVIGLGGGAGGAFRGRGGRRNLSSAGGGGRRLRQEERSFDAGNLARLQSRSGLLFDKEASDFGLGAAAGLEIRRRFADTAAWQPRLVTNARGVATFEVELPDNLTTWRALARGVSRTALVGEGRGRVVSRKDLLVRIDTPRFLVQGDALTVPVAVHNDTGAEADVRVTVTSEGVDLRGGEKTLRVADGGRAVVDTEVSAPTPGRVRFEATARAGDRGDRTEVGLGAKPRGIRVVDGRTGVLTTEGGADQQTFLDVPERAVKGATSLVVVLYPGIDDALLDALLYLDLYPYGCIEQTVNRFLPALEARKALLAAGSPDAARLKRLDEAVRRGALRLRMVQATNGSFGWFRGGHGNLAMTAYALLGFAGAREAGVKDLDLPIQRASDALRTLLKSGSEDARALAHLALATVGRADRGAYATTFRRRNDDLSVSGLAWLAVAAKRMGRSYDADELVRLLLERRVDEGTTTHWKGARESCFVGSDREATGLAAAALLLTGRGNDAVAERALAWLIANRTAGGFGSTKATAAFVQAASAWVTTHGAQGYGGTVTLALDGETVRTVKTGPEGLAAKDRRFALPEAAALAPGRHTLAFRLEGQGKLHWAVRLTSVVSSDDLPGEAHGLTVKRSFLRPEEVPLEGKPAPIKPGYSILREASRPRVEARELEVVGSGDRVLVRLEIQAPRDLQYVLIEDPLPAGFEVLDDTAQGLFDWQERRDDRQVFFCSRVPKGTLVLRYVIQATHWGSFTALGTTAAAMYLPEVHGRAAGRVLTVARGGAGGAQVEVPPTPDELYERAKRLFAAGERKESLALFRGLEKEQPLRDEIVEEIESYLLKAAIESKDAKGIVRAREALVRRNPARIGSDWETQRAIAFAYDEVGEYETAASLFRSLVARGFGLHVDWARTLIDRDRKVEGLDGLGLALRAFPVSNATAQAAFWRAQRYRDLPRPKGRALPPGQPMDEETREALYEFTANYAETSLADPANYAIVDALRRAGDLTGAATAAEAFLARFPGSVYEDDARYFLAVSRFGTFEKAPTPEKAKAVEEAARPLVTQKFPGRDGQKRTSEFRVRALDLLARTYHVLGDLDQAVKLYWAARSLRDARESYDFLTQERLDLEPTIVLPLEGGAEVPLGYRNVGKVSFKAYPVDLQVLFAVRKTLSGLHDVDLSGIVPAHAWEIAFADAQDHLGHRRDVELPVEAGKAGAWLLVVKAGDHEAKSLVIKTDLKVVLQWIGKKLRVHVIDPAGRGVAEAYVTVSDGQRIRARGLTDGRGLFEAPGVGTGAAVVVSKDDRYAVGR